MTNSEKRTANRGFSQRMQVDHQIVQLLPRQLLLEGWHLGAAQEDDVRNPIVVGGNAIFHEWLFEQPIQAGCAQVMCAVGVMTFGTTRIVNPPALCLLWSQSELGIALARFGIAGQKDRNHDQNNCSQKGKRRAFWLQRNLPGVVAPDVCIEFKNRVPSGPEETVSQPLPSLRDSVLFSTLPSAEALG